MANIIEKKKIALFDIDKSDENQKNLEQIDLNSEAEELRFLGAHLDELRSWAEKNSWNYTAYFLEKAQESLLSLDSIKSYEEKNYGTSSKN